VRNSKALSAALFESQAIAEEAAARLARLEAEVRELRGYRLRCDDLEGTAEALQQEVQKLKSARSVLDADLKAARAEVEAQSRQLAQLQGSAALAKSKADEQAAQLRMLKQQLLDMEEEVCVWLPRIRILQIPSFLPSSRRAPMCSVLHMADVLHARNRWASSCYISTA
jgi:chromosome segregation ATPase